MGIYFGSETFGVRILKSDNDGDFKIMWEFIGPECEFGTEVIVQVLKPVSCTHDAPTSNTMWVRMV